MLRECLVTKFVCSVCGSNLTITNTMPTAAVHYAEGQPTGAAMVDMRVAVEPCKKCFAPLADIRNALKVIGGLVND